MWLPLSRATTQGRPYRYERLSNINTTIAATNNNPPTSACGLSGSRSTMTAMMVEVNGSINVAMLADAALVVRMPV